MESLDDPAARAEVLLAQAAASWDSECQAQVLLEAHGLRDAEWARCRLVDRLRVAMGPVGVDLRETRVRGWVQGAGPQVTVLDDGRERHAVALGSIIAIRGLGPGLAEERPAAEHLLALGWASVARSLIGETVRILRVDGVVFHARIEAAGADHLDAVVDEAASMTIPFAALALVRSPSRMGAR